MKRNHCEIEIKVDFREFKFMRLNKNKKILKKARKAKRWKEFKKNGH